MNELEIIQKGQTMRLFDVFLIAPAMVAAGFYVYDRRETKTEEYFSFLLMGIGVGTFTFNGKNYLRQKSKMSTPGQIE